MGIPTRFFLHRVKRNLKYGSYMRISDIMKPVNMEVKVDRNIIVESILAKPSAFFWEA
jgi:hypothetical protein